MPLDLRLEYIGGGAFRTRTKLDWELCERELEQNAKVHAKLTKPRSVKQNAMFHVMIQEAFDNQRGGPTLPTWKHLRSWLLIQVGHCVVKTFEAGTMTPEIAAFLREQFDTVDFSTDGENIYMKIAKSVSFTKADSAVMQPVVDQVIALICDVIVPGITPAELTTEARAKAA